MTCWNLCKPSLLCIDMGACSIVGSNYTQSCGTYIWEKMHDLKKKRERDREIIVYLMFGVGSQWIVLKQYKQA